MIDAVTLALLLVVIVSLHLRVTDTENRLATLRDILDQWGPHGGPRTIA